MSIKQEQNSLICSIEHPLFDSISNVTRRQILRLIACEHNYGNRIANILDVSSPAIHRHLSQLESDENIKLIEASKVTKESFSGKKGAEATLYKISETIGLFFVILPNYVHNHIIARGDNRGVVKNIPEGLKTISPSFPTGNEGEKLERKIKFYNLYKVVQESNKRIESLERQLMDELENKNSLMGEIDELLKEDSELSYEDRVILRAITCLGKHCSSDLSHLMNLDMAMLQMFVESLRERNWIEKKRT